MKCPKCQFDNPDEMKFCGQCGTALRDDILKDRFSLITDYTPTELKERILQAGKQIESERRFVTVLFADLSGYTSLSEKLDPETVTMVLNSLFSGLISIINKYEGLIIDFFGDGILAIFGAPLAHENDPERAVRTTLEMLPYVDRFNMVSPHKLREPLGLHIGIHSGLVVVGNVGSDLRMRYSAVGDTVNLCSRIADHATRGEIYISEDTYKLLSNQITTEPPQSIQVKGKGQPVTVYKLLSMKDKAPGEPVTRPKGFVGRKREKETISQALSRVLEKKGERLLICGEPGVGKTRLKEELVQLSISSGLAVFEGRCSSLETKTPYYLWNMLLKGMLRISPDANESEVKKQLHDTLAILFMNVEEPYIATLLSLRYEEILLEDDQERKRHIFEAVYKLIDNLGKRQTTAYILEDLHWADRFSKELLEYLMKKDESVPSLFCIIFRPEYTEYKNIMDRASLINLDRLSEEDSLELMKLRLNAETIPDNLKDLINRRTEGNPFFIEESLKTLQEKGFISVSKGKVKILSENLESGVPETVQGVIMARIDRLEGRIREVLLNASVIGREFSRRLIERVIDRKEDILSDLSHLKGLELILEREEVREFEYLFKHYMIQEVAYNTILINKRKKLHGLIARAIEEIYHDRLNELYELLAFHYEKAEEWEKAAEYYGRAGRKVREIYTEEESKDLFNRKEHAIEKIYESAPQRGLGYKILFGFCALFYFGSLLFLIYGAALSLARISSAFRKWATDPANWANWQIIIVSIYILILFFVLWWSLSFLYIILTIIFQRIKFFELMSDGLEIVKGDNTRFSIPFSHIESIGIVIPKKSKLFYKEVDQYNAMDDYKKISIFKFIYKDLITTNIGLGTVFTKGLVTINCKSGFKWLRFFLPWLFNLGKSKYYSLHPSDPEEFFDQLYTAYEKWKRLNIGSSTS
jgi:class 3 adenylate cyclase